MELDQQVQSPMDPSYFHLLFHPCRAFVTCQMSVFRVHLTSRNRGIVAGIEMSNSINPSTLIGAENRTPHRKKEIYDAEDATRLKGEYVDGPIAGNDLQAVAWRDHCANASTILEDTADQDHCSSE